MAKKWTQKYQDYWKGKCEKNDLNLPDVVNEAILIFIGQVEYLTHLIADGQLIISAELVSSPDPVAELLESLNAKLKAISSLKKRALTLEKRVAALEPKPQPTPIFYENGKPTRKKPKQFAEKT